MTENTPQQVPFGPGDFAENPEPRVACLLLLDRSGSMQGSPIAELNAGVDMFKSELLSDEIAQKRAEVAVISFGPVKTESDFQLASNFFPPQLEAGSDTPMGEAIKTGLQLVEGRKGLYKSRGIAYYRPWVFLITDGAPTDDWGEAARLVKEGEASHSFAFFAIGVGGANMEILKQISVREPLKLQGTKFREFFLWLSKSMKSVSRSTPGEGVKLEPPHGWAEV